MDKAFDLRLQAAGFPEQMRRHISLHSFHGSHTARERAMGIPKAATCQDMHWSEEMYDHYLEGRRPLTIQGIMFWPLPEEDAEGA
jgi:hypothetical protein